MNAFPMPAEVSKPTGSNESLSFIDVLGWLYRQAAIAESQVRLRKPSYERSLYSTASGSLRRAATELITAKRNLEVVATVRAEHEGRTDPDMKRCHLELRGNDGEESKEV